MSVELRPLALEMTEDLAVLANDAVIAGNVRDRFPHPYTRGHAQEFIAASMTQNPRNEYAVFLDGCFAGMCGLIPGEDVHRLTAELGYWVGAPFRGQGVASAAVAQLTLAGFSRGFARIFAGVYEWNHASMRVLEKNGFYLECIQERAITKGTRTGSQHVYVLLNPEFDRDARPRAHKGFSAARNSLPASSAK